MPSPTDRLGTVLNRSVVFGFLARTTTMVVLLTGAYYTWPTRSPVENGSNALRLVAAVVSVGLVAIVLRAQRRAIRRSPRLVTVVEALLTALYFLVIVFAAVYFRVATSSDQFAGLETKTDGLYFTVTVFSTVGFGDVHAVGSAGRALVTAQMLFSLLYLGTAIRLLSAGRTQVVAALPAMPRQEVEDRDVSGGSATGLR